ncbi:hypothetical protein CHUAL_010248 [Chamberlinius hualienensis]
MLKSNPTAMDIQRMRLTLAQQLGKKYKPNEDDNLASEQDFQMDSSDMEHHSKIHHSPSSFSHKDSHMDDEPILAEDLIKGLFLNSISPIIAGILNSKLAMPLQQTIDKAIYMDIGL